MYLLRSSPTATSGSAAYETDDLPGRVGGCSWRTNRDTGGPDLLLKPSGRAGRHGTIRLSVKQHFVGEKFQKPSGRICFGAKTTIKCP